MNLNIKSNTLETEGKIKYGYSPLHNYYSSESKLIEDLNGKNLFKFSLNNPVDILPFPTYDGSVNLMLTDDLNIPKMINSRFKMLENNRYEIPIRLNENATNVYHYNKFSIESSLLKSYNNIPRINLKQVDLDGELKVGTYVFYIKYSDSDGNSTNIAAESGIIQIFKGDQSQCTIDGGYRFLNSHKSIILNIENLDTQYNYLKVYYTIDTSDINQEKVTNAYEITKLFKYENNTFELKIDGIEPVKEITIAELNKYNISINSAKTHTICLNRLFYGNIEESTDDILELTDISLRFGPVIDTKSILSNYDYLTNKYSDVNNIHNELGYWSEEMYRFGIVYVYNTGNISRVYNTRGINLLPTVETEEYSKIEFLDSNKERKYISYNRLDFSINEFENAKGVVRIPQLNINTLIGIKFKFISSYENINDEFEAVKQELAKRNIIGYYFVRQKRIPTILTLATIYKNTVRMDELSQSIPLLPNDKYESFLNNSGNIVHSYNSRLKDPKRTEVLTYYGICPDYILNQPYYNQIFTGTKLSIKIIGNQQSNLSNSRLYTIDKINDNQVTDLIVDDISILGIPDNTKTMAIDDSIFTGVCGVAEEAFRIANIENYNKDWEWTYDEKESPDDYTIYSKKAGSTNLVRGIFGPRLGIKSNTGLTFNNGDIINIYIPGYNTNKFDLYFKMRYLDNSSFYSITHRYELDNTSVENFGYIKVNNKELVAYRGDRFICLFTWRVNRNFQDPSSPINETIVDEETFRRFYTTDPGHIGMWSYINRSDVNAVPLGSWITTYTSSSNNLNIRSIDMSYPDEKSLTGLYRSYYPNYGLNTSGSNKIPDSDVFNKGFGSTTGHLINICLNDQIYENNKFFNRIIYSDINSTSEYINSLRIFPADNYRDYNIEYGGITKLITVNNNIVCVFEHAIAVIPIKERIQTAGKDGSAVYLNSDNVLPENIIFLTSLYGSQWKDSIIKTDSDKIYGVDTVAKKIWMISGSLFKLISDLIIGEFLNENIPLKEFEILEIIGLRNVKTHYNAFKGDVMFTFYTPEFNNSKYETAWNICYNDLQLKWITFYSWIPLISTNCYNIMYSIDRNYARMIQQFNKCNNLLGEENRITQSDLNKLKFGSDLLKRIHIIIKKLGITEEYNQDANYLCELAFEIPLSKYRKLSEFELLTLQLICSNTIYKHGQGGIIDNQEKITPCKWYDKQHPFEFEFIVNDTPQSHKLFNNMRLLSNKAKPESFHYEIIGECYEFANDKKNMYYRQEAKKELFRNMGSDISFDSNYYNIKPSLNPKSTDTLWYYARVDTDENVEDSYLNLDGTPNKDYRNLSGTEIVHYDKLNEYRLWEHSKAEDIKKVGRLRGNMQYLEDFWNIQINPIIITEKNEKWNKKPPLTLFNSQIPNDLSTTKVTDLVLPKDYTINDVDLTKWNKRREIKLKDKWMKVRIRYSGEDLALISALYTMYSISYA